MKIITFYTETHKYLHEKYLLPSLDNKLCEIITKKGTQISNDGGFFSYGFRETMFDKLRFIVEVMGQHNEDEEFIFMDSDIIVKDLNELLEYIIPFKKIDLVFQSDLNTACAGFFYFKNKKENLELFNNALKLNHLNNDQLAINTLLNSDINYSLFDYKINNYSFYSNGDIWEEHKLFEPTNDIVVFHANYTVGVNTKIKLLDYVKNKLKW